MNLTFVKTAAERRLRHPATGKVMPNVADTGSAPFKVDLDDPHWFRALKRGDIVVVQPAAAPAGATATASTTAATTGPSAASPAKAAPAAAPGTSVEA